MLTTMGQQAKAAARLLAVTDSAAKNRALQQIAAALENNTPQILAANQQDMQRAAENNMTSAMRDRLRLDAERIHGMAEGLRMVAQLPDPVGRVLDDFVRPNGLHIVKTAVPIGVIGIIFEARPNVTADSAALCLKSGNAVILRGGSDAIDSNTAICRVMRQALVDAGLPADSVQLVADTSRESAAQLMQLTGYVDVIIPRGGAGLIRSVLANATVPVIQTGAGTCHIYVDQDADLDMAVSIIDNAKTSRPSVCNAAECMLIHRAIAATALPRIAAALLAKKVEIRGDEEVRRLVREAIPAQADDWGREYDDYIIAARIVDDVDDAIEHITNYGTGHSECIVTDNAATAQKFLTQVDAAAVYHNASTRFTDGGEFGMGAEIGISTQKLHARGPLGLRELTSMKYTIYGSGQIR